MRPRVPPVTQYASPSLIAAICYAGHPPDEDPRWPETGAPDLAAYAAWCARWCGMACFRMALLARDGDAPTLYELALGCQEYGGYSDAPGAPGGLIYRPFAQYALDKFGMPAEVITDLDPDRLLAELDRGRLVIASVHASIRQPSLEPPRKGGHLVLVTGHSGDLIAFQNPSGHSPAAVMATLPVADFYRFAAGRGIALSL
jgi:hypothetical protein